jgi:hypothetical protein
LKYFCQWILEQSPVQSGTEKRHILQFNTYKAAYNQYSIDVKQQKNFKPLSLSFFMKWVHNLNVRLPKFNKYMCPKCTKSNEVCVSQNSNFLRSILIQNYLLDCKDTTSKTHWNPKNNPWWTTTKTWQSWMCSSSWLHSISWIYFCQD